MPTLGRHKRRLLGTPTGAGTLGPMEYVMVPVPEDLVEEVRDFMAWGMTTTTDEPENPDALAELYAGAGPEARAILNIVAAESIAEVRPTLTDVAERTGLSTHAVIGVLTELNYRLQKLRGPFAVVLVRDDPRPMPEGRNPWEHRILHMTRQTAGLIDDLSAGAD